MSDDVPPTRHEAGVGWGFAVLAAVIVMIILGWGSGGHGHGWGRSNELAHMMPPAVDSGDGPATRAWITGPPNGR
jgi:hypothetical protein